jgi:hypothetical protein
MDTVSYVLAMEEISKIDASVSVCMSVNNSLVCWDWMNMAATSNKIPDTARTGKKRRRHLYRAFY